MKFDNKSLRILDLFERFSKGEALNKKELALEYGVSEKSIQRDISELKNFLSEKYPDKKDDPIIYDSSKKAFSFEKMEKEYLTCKEVMAITKIMLESRAFNKAELNLLLDKLTLQASPNDRATIKEMILNERYHYVPLQHGEPLIETIWEVSGYIKRQEMIKFAYIRQDKKKLNRIIKPVAIVFSEFYFYLIGYIEDVQKDFPAVFRLDRCQGIKGTKQKFRIPYEDSFSLGEFRNRVQFMYPGELMKVKFKFWGSSLEAVLDRLPTARVLGKDGDKHIVEAEIFGGGIKMWFLSQMEFLEVLEPKNLREETINAISKLKKIYDS